MNKNWDTLCLQPILHWCSQLSSVKNRDNIGVFQETLLVGIFWQSWTENQVKGQGCQFLESSLLFIMKASYYWEALILCVNEKLTLGSYLFFYLPLEFLYLTIYTHTFTIYIHYMLTFITYPKHTKYISAGTFAIVSTWRS